jgi:hypothetical protein
MVNVAGTVSAVLNIAVRSLLRISGVALPIGSGCCGLIDPERRGTSRALSQWERRSILRRWREAVDGT